MKLFVVFSLFTVCVFGRYVSSKAEGSGNSANNILNKCADGIQEFTDCLKYKAIKLLDQVILNEKPIPLTNFLYLTHEGLVNTTEYDVNNEEEALKGEHVNGKLNQILERRVRMIASTKNLQLKLDAGTGLGDDQGEGRKKKNGQQMMMMVMGAGAMLMHAAMSKIAFIAGKALIVAKIALVISAVIGLKKLLTPDDHHDSTQVIYKQAESSGSGGGGWHRSIDNPTDQVYAHHMAYGGQIRHES